MKMLFIMPYMKYSGAPKMMAKTANWFAEAGNDVTICTFFKGDVTQLLDDNIKLDCLSIERSPNRIKRMTVDFIRVEKLIFNYISTFNADVLITFGDLFSTLLLKKLKHKKQCVIVSERADPGGNSVFSKFRRHMFGYANGFVFQTEGAKQCFSEVIQNRAFVIPNPVTLSEIETLPYNKRKKKIVCVGRFEFKQKRQDLLIQAFAKVFEKHPDYTLYFYGDGEDMEKAKVLASQTNAANAMIFVGAVSPIEKYINDAALLVMSSDYEGIPNAVIEAMNMQIPVVSCDCRPGGARLLLGDNQYGRLVPTGDADALAREICYMLDHPEYAFDITKKAKSSLKRFEESAIAALWKNAVEQILTKGE